VDTQVEKNFYQRFYDQLSGFMNKVFGLKPAHSDESKPAEPTQAASPAHENAHPHADAHVVAQEAAQSAAPSLGTLDLSVFHRVDTQVGHGDEAYPGMHISVHYTGWLLDTQAHDLKGQKFDSSLDRGQTFNFPLGAGHVIQGWDEGFAGMKIGGKRTLLIPPEMGYGARGAGGVIPPNATLLFEVELLGVN
jgi:FKBP-type peptidyl-prolyl cis-trans isomerase